ncbi:MAG: acylphosphatase [Rhodobacteraceae bacterium]|nr:acylphosphatase [Paracoccaceae bacterium]
MSDIALRARITGRVQGVTFRAWTRSEAEQRGLSGWVRNEPDGSVRALLIGPVPHVPESPDVASTRRCNDLGDFQISARLCVA